MTSSRALLTRKVGFDKVLSINERLFAMNKFIGCAVIALVAGGALAVEELPQMSPFDDVKYWFRGGVDLSGNGVYDSGSYECRDVAHASNATHANHVMKLHQGGTGYEPPKACIGKVVMPYAGQVLTDAPYLHLPQRVETNGTFVADTGVEYPIVKLHANYIDLPTSFLTDLPSGVSCTNYTAFIRFRDQSKVSERQGEHHVFAMGYSWGGKCGVGVAVSDSSGTLSPRIYIGDSYQNITDDGFKVRYGHWCDLAIVVAGDKVTVAMCPNVNEVGTLTNRLAAFKTLTAGSGKNPAIIPSQRLGRIGGEDAGISGTYTNGYAQGNSGTHNDAALSNKAKAFRGDIQTFAFWPRALTTNEILQVFSERRPAVVRMGLANGTSDEFTGTDDGTTDANGSHPEAWNPVLNAAHPTTTVKFTVVDGEQDVGQFLRIRPVPGSAKAIVAVKIDGRLVTALRASGSEDAFAYISATYLTKGDHTITFTRTDGGSGDFAIDAFQLSGSWRIGNTKDTYGGMVHETDHPYQYKAPRRFPLTDGNMDHFSRGLSGGPGADNGTHIIPFDVPADILERIGDATLSLAFNGGSTTAISVQVNDAEAEELAVTDNSGSLMCSIPAANLVAGENTLKIKQLNGSWLNCKKYALELAPPAAEAQKLDATDPHADAVIWWRGMDMRTADGTAHGAILYNSATGETMTPTVNGTADDVQIRTESIFCPYRHRATTGKTIYFAQPTWTNEVSYEDGSVTNFLHVRTSRLDFSNIFSDLAVPLRNYTVQVRFRVDESPSRWNGLQRWLIRAGFDWGGNCGLAFGLKGSGTTDLDLDAFHGTAEFVPASGGTTAQANSWNDVIISVKDAKVITTLFCRENDYPRIKTETGASANAYIKRGGVFQLGTEGVAADKSIPLGKEPEGIEWKAFRGSVAEVAFWRRALTQEEMHAALGNPQPGIFRLGVDNGMSTEFTGTEAAEVYDADNDTLDAAPPVLSSASREVTVNAFISQMNATLPQVLRLKPTFDFGGTATVQLYVNGRKAEAPQEVKPDAFAYFPVRASSFAANAVNTFKFVRTDAGTNPITIDMVDLVGSWNLGGPETQNIYFSHESSAVPDYYVSNGRWMSLVRGVTSGNKTSPAFRIHFTVPKELAEEYDYLYDFRLCDGTGGTDATCADRALFKVLLNGEEIWSTIDTPSTDPTRRPYIIDLAGNPIRIPAGTLNEGDNTIEVYALPNSPSGKYQSFCRHRLRLAFRPNGTLLILR